MIDGKSHLLSGFGWEHLPVPSTRFDGYQQPSCGYLRPPYGYSLRSHVYRQPLHGYRQPLRGYPQPRCWYQLPVRSERETLSSRILQRTDCTHVEDVKDSDKILLPSRNLLLITLREYESEHRTPFTLLDDLPLDTRQCSAIETSASE